MSMVPHFDLPFRLGTAAAVVEQNTEDDIYNCVLASLLHHLGQRPEAPGFGAGDLAFKQQPLDLNTITEKVITDEPRAALFLEQQPNVLNTMIAEITVMVGSKESS